jgi:membrane associated rhomboid family serine protease
VIILPWGFGFKFKRFPYITLILCAISVVMYFKDPLQPTRVEDKIKNIYSNSKLGESEGDLFRDFCDSQGGDDGPCTKLAEQIEKGYEFDDGKNDAPEETQGEKKPAKSRKKLKFRTLDSGGDDLFDEEQTKKMSFNDLAKEELRYNLIATNFRRKLADPDEEFRNLGGYENYADAQAGVQDSLTSFFKSQQLLSSANLTPRTLVEAQFSHGSLEHLIGNMLFLFLFGAYVEQRMTGLFYVFVYLAGGTIGLLTQLLLFRNPEIFIVGASANISAVMGLFFVYFFRFRMKFVASWMFVSWRTFYAPVALTFPVLFILNELVSGLDGLEVGTNVAHFAHLAGVVVGAYAGFLSDSFKPLPFPFLYHSEKDDFEKLKASRTLSEKLSIGEYILGYNQQNSVVRYYVLAQCLEACRNSHLIDARIKVFLKKNLALALEEKIGAKKLPSAYQLVCQCPTHLPFKSVIGEDFSQQSLLALGDHALHLNNLMIALRCYDLFLMRYPKSKKKSALKMTIKEILAHVQQSDEMAADWRDFVQHHDKSPVAAMTTISEVTVTKTGGVNGRAAN